MTLLAVHAHPDDETIFTGALLATWAAAGRPVTVVTCTRGERGEVIPEDLGHLRNDPEALAAHRERELASALRRLGVADQVFLDAGATTRYRDSGMTWLAPGRAGPVPEPAEGSFVDVPVEEAAELLAEVITSRRPAVVVGYGPDGGYGHPDHIHAHRVMHRAVELAAPAYRVAALLHRDWERPELLVDLAAVATKVADALRAHRTQVQQVRARTDGVTFALSNGQVQRLSPDEGYRFAPEWPPTVVTWPAGVRR